MNWLDFLPTFLSTISSIAAAYAAIVSLRISKQSILISKSNALAEHHKSASIKYAEVINHLNNTSRDFAALSYNLGIEWSRKIESFDNAEKGGKDPRPLRHVISNGSQMLANFAYHNRNNGIRSISKSILSVIRYGINDINQDEFQRLLRKADGQYMEFEGIFGDPKNSKSIASTNAFRWTYYQLVMRVTSAQWRKEWENAWLDNGLLTTFKSEYIKIKPMFETAHESLKNEITKIAHSALPLNYNSQLFEKYERILNILENLIDDCDIEQMELYKSWPHKEELSLFVICSIAIAEIIHKELNMIYIIASE